MSQRWPHDRTAALAKVFGFERVSNAWRLTCSACQRHEDFPFGPSVSVINELIPAARDASWLVVREGASRCLSCCSQRTADFAKLYGFQRVSVADGYVWRLTCCICEQQRDFTLSPTINIGEVLVPAARETGWIVMREGLTRCPTCHATGGTRTGGRAMRHLKNANATQDEAVRDLQDYGVRPGRTASGVPCWESECACGLVGQVQTEYNPDLRTLVTTAVKRLNRLHWNVVFGKPPRCPTCARKDLNQPLRERWDEQGTVIDSAPVAAPLALPAPVEASITTIGFKANEMQAAVHKLIAIHFDWEKGLYRPDWDDARIAAESGTQLAFVVSLRRAHYGELAEPPEVTEWRRKIEALEAKQSAQRADLADDERVLAELKAQLAKMSAGKRRLSIDAESTLAAEIVLKKIREEGLT
jgi:hypothetical protein